VPDAAVDLAQLISTDQAMTARILESATSASYGPPRQIATVHLTGVLGFDAVKELRLTISVLEPFAAGDAGGVFDRTPFWEHTIASGDIWGTG